MGASCYTDLMCHVGHDIQCVAYDAEYEYEGDPANIAIECVTCGEVLLDFDFDHAGKVPDSRETA